MSKLMYEIQSLTSFLFIPILGFTNARARQCQKYAPKVLINLRDVQDPKLYMLLKNDTEVLCIYYVYSSC